MNVLLIDPPVDFDDMGGSREGFREVQNVIPPLGLAYLAAVAERDGHESRIAECAFGGGRQAIEGALRGFEPQVVGLTATTPGWPSAVRTAAWLRSRFPGALIVAGGPHPTADPLGVLADSPETDLVVVGEGEATFAELLAWEQGGRPRPVETIAGLACRRGVAGVLTPAREPIADLDTVPLPARHRLRPLSEYRPTPASCRQLPLGVVMTTRGCLSRCVFCDRAVFGDRCRKRSVENVMTEVEDLRTRHGAREIRFFDDTFTVDAARVARLCAEMKRTRLPWTCLTKAASVTADLLRTMREAGCWQVLFGLESGDEAVLKSLCKGNTVEMNRRAVRWARQAGLRVRADFLVGSPAETPESLARTLALALELPLDFAHFNKFVPYPGTEIYRRLTAQGRRFEFGDAAFVNNHTALPYVPDGLDPQAYLRFLDAAYRKFYLRPGYLLRRLAGLRTWTELRGQLRGLGAILSL